MKRIFIVSVIVGLWWLLACQSGQKADQPPTIRYGEDPCDECFMLINEKRFAAAYVTEQGEVRRFDDIGCMIVHMKKHADKVKKFWVVDYNSQRWLDAQRAYFVKSTQLETPMGYGVVAFQDSAMAQQFADKLKGEVWRFTQVKKLKQISR